MNLNESDQILLDYLMTADFKSENMTHEEMIFLLNKFRNFYRVIHSVNRSQLHEIEALTKKVKECEEQKLQHEKENLNKTNLINYINNKKLSLIERIKGKIKPIKIK